MKSSLIVFSIVLMTFSTDGPGIVSAQTPKIPTPPVEKTAPAKASTDVAPAIELDASRYTGNPGGDWRDVVVFSENTVGITLRWTYARPGIDHAEIQIHDASGELLGSHPVHTAGDKEQASFVMSLPRLPHRSAYLVRIRPIDAGGSAIYSPSNTVALLYD